MYSLPLHLLWECQVMVASMVFKATWNALVTAKTSEGCAPTNETTINTPSHREKTNQNLNTINNTKIKIKTDANNEVVKQRLLGDIVCECSPKSINFHRHPLVT